jgi:hypothetical protein
MRREKHDLNHVLFAVYNEDRDDCADHVRFGAWWAQTVEVLPSRATP